VDSYLVASIVFACVFTGSLIGLSLNAWLPEHHRSPASHDAIKLSTGMISVLASLVLGLLTASIKNSFDTIDGQMRTFAANLILTDQTLRDYGPEADTARGLLRDYTTQAIDDHWPQENNHPVRMENTGAGNAMDRARLTIISLASDTTLRQMLRASALQSREGLLQTRWQLIEREGTSIQPVFLIVLVTWIVLIFLAFGYNAPWNATVVSAFFISSVALSACLFIIVEMDSPFDGVITVSSHAMRDALAHMSQ
jgi:hypothetical protein